MKASFHRGLVFGLIALSAMSFSASALRAQSTSTVASPAPATQDSSDQGFHISFTPYLWFSGIHGTIAVDGHEASIHQSASDVLSNLDIGFMLAAEPRYNRIVFPVDLLWVKLSDSKGLPFEDGYYSAKVTLKETIFTQKVGYRFIDQKKFKVDALVGVRVWYFKNQLDLEPIPPFGGLTASKGWIDGVAGAKFQGDLGHRAFIVVFGDAGGGSARSDYQVGGALGFRLSKRWSSEAGYRYMSVNYGSRNAFLADITQSGVVLGLTYAK